MFWVSHPWVVAVLLGVNFLSAVNFTRVFRLAFLGKPQPKTRRAPEVPWPMAVPMVSLILVTLFLPVIMLRLSLLPDWSYLNLAAVVLLVLSGLTGTVAGGAISLDRNWSRPVQPRWRFLQDLLAYDFYIDRLYRLTVVFAVNRFSRITAWFDRYVVDGAVNLVGLSAIFGGEGLKYNVSGQSQFYVLTIVVGVGLLVILMSWPF